MKSNNGNEPDRLNRIVEGTNIYGELKGESNIRIDGYVKGTIETTGKVVVGSAGVIEGNVKCSNADIEGRIIGNINLDELLVLKNTATIEGDICTSKLSIEPGSVFTGQCKMGKGQINPKSNEQAKQKNNGITKKQKTSDDVVY